MNLSKRMKGKLEREAFSLAGKIGSCQIKNSIVIAGSPRSGTTLLLEALHKISGYKAINEPLLTPQIQNKKGFDSRSYISIGDSADNQKRFLEQVLMGQLGPSARWMFDAETTFGRIIEHSMRDKLMVKFCRINRMLPWFADQFNVCGIIFILRHPCAVVNSMLRYGQWDMWTSEFVQKNKHNTSNALCIDHLPESVREVFAPIQERVSTPTEILAMMWCLDHYIPLVHNKIYPWILVPYERLIKNNHKELVRITDALDVELNNDVLRVIDKPSSSVKGTINEDTGSQIEKWENKLTNLQIDSILSIVNSAGLSSIYSENTEPHYDYLNTLQLSEWKW